ncbi:MAG: hypothetical protein ACK8QZ_07415 [Anaerolineales bacterium]
MEDAKNLDKILLSIRSALLSCEGQAKSGSQIHKIILDAAPGIDIRSIVGIPSGPGALTKFIETYFSAILRRIGMQGGDVLYGIGEGVAPPPEDDSPSIWKAFVSPSAPNYLYLRISDMKLIVSADNGEANAENLHVAKVTDEEHQKVREAFLLGLSEDQRAKIEPSSNPNFSYDEFVEMLRSNGLMKLWGEFRRDAFKDALAQRLQELSVDEQSIPIVLGQLMASQKSLFRSEATKSAVSTTTSTDLAPKFFAAEKDDKLESARSFARAVINGMGYEELRTLQVPFGAVLDALGARK